MRVHFVVHEAFEMPGAILLWARQRGHAITFSRVYEHEPLPTNADGIDLLVVMGGPQSPATTREACPHFDSAAEQRLIRQCVEAQRAVVGVCLGAQMIGAALGAPVSSSPETEIGAFPIALTEAGRADPRLAAFAPTEMSGHWHNDMPGLTRDAVVLATSDGCPRQIIRYAPLVYGFQCHMEFTPEAVELLIAVSEDELAAAASRPFVQQADTLRVNDYRGMNAKLMQFLDALVADLQLARGCLKTTVFS